jgi:hypothetical protein
MGQYTLSLPETLRGALEYRAQKEGVSLNQYILNALTRQVASTYTIQALSDEDVRQQKKSFDKLLSNLGQGTLAEAKAILEEREIGELEEGLTEEMVERVEKMIAERGDSNGR